MSSINEPGTDSKLRSPPILIIQHYISKRLREVGMTVSDETTETSRYS